MSHIASFEYALMIKQLTFEKISLFDISYIKLICEFFNKLYVLCIHNSYKRKFY